MSYLQYLIDSVAAMLHREEEGQTLVEYALIIALVSVALVAVLLVMTGSLQTVFNTIANTISNAGK